MDTLGLRPALGLFDLTVTTFQQGGPNLIFFEASGTNANLATSL